MLDEQINPTLQEYHRFLDEAGDTTFFGKGGIPIIGNAGVSTTFIIGMVRFNTDLPEIRLKIIELAKEIESGTYFKNIPSIIKRSERGGYYFHAKDDLPEIRKQFFDFIRTLDCSFQAVAGRKLLDLYVKKHNKKSNEFYADLLSHLIKDKFERYDKLVLNIASRESSTSYQNLQTSLQKSKERFLKRNENKSIKAQISFNVQPYMKEPLLSIADYFCWSVQRVFEKGETRFYDYIQDKISLVVDLYDRENYSGGKNYYTSKNPLTVKNKIGPQSS
jgi:hypothetical protein